MEAKIGTMDTNINKVQSDVNNLQEGQNALNTKVGAMDTNITHSFAASDTKINNLQDGQSSILGGMEKMMQRLMNGGIVTPAATTPSTPSQLPPTRHPSTPRPTRQVKTTEKMRRTAHPSYSNSRSQPAPQMITTTPKAPPLAHPTDSPETYNYWPVTYNDNGRTAFQQFFGSFTEPKILIFFLYR